MIYIERQNEMAIKYFDSIFAEHGPTVKALGWGSTFSQQQRFKALSEIGDLRDQTVLDVGCGFGDFWGFLKGYGFRIVKYVGLDINENMLKIAAAKYPDSDLWNAHFENRNILLNPMDEKFDYVFASGLFFMNIAGWTQFIHQMLSIMFNIAVKAIGVNFLSIYTPGKISSNSIHVSPEKITDFVIKELSNNFILKHDYLPNDFTICVFKEQL